MQDDLLRVTRLTPRFPLFLRGITSQVARCDLPLPFRYSTVLVRPTQRTDERLELGMFRGPVLLFTGGSRGGPAGDRCHCKQ
jgi:hypothetical protein